MAERTISPWRQTTPTLQSWSSPEHDGEDLPNPGDADEDSWGHSDSDSDLHSDSGSGSDSSSDDGGGKIERAMKRSSKSKSKSESKPASTHAAPASGLGPHAIDSTPAWKRAALFSDSTGCKVVIAACLEVTVSGMAGSFLPIATSTFPANASSSSSSSSSNAFLVLDDVPELLVAMKCCEWFLHHTGELVYGDAHLMALVRTLSRDIQAALLVHTPCEIIAKVAGTASTSNACAPAHLATYVAQLLRLFYLAMCLEHRCMEIDAPASAAPCAPNTTTRNGDSSGKKGSKNKKSKPFAPATESLLPASSSGSSSSVAEEMVQLLESARLWLLQYPASVSLSWCLSSLLRSIAADAAISTLVINASKVKEAKELPSDGKQQQRQRQIPPARALTDTDETHEHPRPHLLSLLLSSVEEEQLLNCMGTALTLPSHWLRFHWLRILEFLNPPIAAEPIPTCTSSSSTASAFATSAPSGVAMQGERKEAEGEPLDLSRICLEITCMALDIRHERELSRRVSVLEVMMRGQRLQPIYVHLVCGFCLGLLHVKFAPLWEPAVQVLVTACKTANGEAVVWPLLLRAIQATTLGALAKNSSSSAAAPATSGGGGGAVDQACGMTSLVGDVALLCSRDGGGDSDNGSGNDGECIPWQTASSDVFYYRVQSAHQLPPHLQHLVAPDARTDSEAVCVQVWGVLKRCPLITLKRSRVIVSFFFR